MSTTKIFIIFGVCVAIIVIPLITLYAWFPSVLGRHVGLVENAIVGIIGAFLVAFSLDFTLRRRQEKALEKVAIVGLAELSQTTNRMIALFGCIFKASSDGFIPSTIDQLFDTRAADLLSLHLSIDSRAPEYTNITWQEYITRESHLIQKNLNLIQDRYQAFFPEDVLVALGKLRNNTLLIVFNQLSAGANFDKQERVSRPVINFTPPETLNCLMSEILSCVKTIERVSIKLDASIIPHFPNFTFRDDVSPNIGSARF